MGWTGSQYYGKGSRKDFLIQEFKQANATHTWWLSDISMRGNTAYCIHWVKDETTGEERHEGMVILTEKRRGDEGWIYHKAIGESVLPYYFNAPKSLIAKLNKLSEPCNDNAKQWRERCLAKASKPSVKVKYGDLVKFSKTLKFPKIALETDTFTYTEWGGKRNIFTNDNGTLVCIPKWQKMEFTVLSN
jgi:hypothetical protein